jgi:hypothetical protein
MSAEDDWRLQGQERYLAGKRLHWSKWTAPASNPSWDHDHCEFCWRKFMDSDDPDVCREGYTTEDRYRWICAQCFNDFRERFGWRL